MLTQVPLVALAQEKFLARTVKNLEFLVKKIIPTLEHFLFLLEHVILCMRSGSE